MDANWLDALLKSSGGDNNYQTEEAKVADQRAIVDMLRKQAMTSGKQDQMIGGGYNGRFGTRPGILVPGNNAATAIGGMALAGMGQYGAGKADESQAANESAMRAGFADWLKSMPQGGVPAGNFPQALPRATAQGAAPTPGLSTPQITLPDDGSSVPQQTLPEVLNVPPTHPEMLKLQELKASGMSDSEIAARMNEQFSTAPAALEAASASIPTSGSVADAAPAPEYDSQKMMQWAGAGMLNPLSKTLASKVWESNVDFPEKQTLQREKANATSLDKMRVIEAALQRTEMQMMDNRLNREQRAVLAKQANDLRATLTRETNGIRQQSVDVQRQLLPLTMGLKQAQIDDKSRGKPLTDKDKEILSKDTGMQNALNNSLSTFKDEYAGYGAAGPLARTAASAVGSWAPKKIQEMDNWWATFEKLAVLPERHEMFGSALTATETAAWNAAQRVRASKDPGQIKAALQVMINIANKHQKAYAAALTAEGKNGASIDALSSPDVPVPAADPSQDPGFLEWKKARGK